VSESGQRVVILNGPPGVGKTTIGRLLAARAANGACIGGDALAGFIVTGSPAQSTRDSGASTVPRSRRTTSGPDTTSWCSSTASSIHGTSTGSWRPVVWRPATARRRRTTLVWASHRERGRPWTDRGGHRRTRGQNEPVKRVDLVPVFHPW